MRIGSKMALVGLGVGGTILYQNIKNGNMKKIVRKMNSSKKQAIEDLEDMI